MVRPGAMRGIYLLNYSWIVIKKRTEFSALLNKSRQVALGKSAVSMRWRVLRRGRSDPSFCKARIVVLVDELNDGLAGIVDMGVEDGLRQISDFDDEPQIRSGWVG